jgi:uncharacterized protein Yka (UPF0111/DUF47 family)
MPVNAMARLFGRSPFVPLQLHLDKISDCVAATVTLLDRICAGEEFDVNEEARAISLLEHKADLVKNDIRNNLPRGLFMAIERGQLLEILSLQDSIADKSEDIAVLMSIRPVLQVMRELDALIESGFGGTEASRVDKMIDEVAHAEHECDIMQRQLMRNVLEHEDELSKGDFFVWQRLLLDIAGISNQSEKLANRVRMLLTLK